MDKKPNSDNDLIDPEFDQVWLDDEPLLEDIPTGVVRIPLGNGGFWNTWTPDDE